MSLQVFIDTNTFLGFYHFSDDTLDKLTNLHSLIEAAKIKLLLPKQIVDEFNRNREGKIKDALKKLDDSQISLPVMCSQYAEASILKAYGPKLADLKEKLLTDAKAKNLKADNVIQEIFSSDRIITISDDILEQAKKRVTMGNPPGKKGSFGDAINWECLLKVCQPGQDLHFVGGDSDFKSELDAKLFSPFLIEEWKKLKLSNVVYYHNVSSFFNKNFPDIQITEEDIKDGKIQEFEHSYSFDDARVKLKKLAAIGDFSLTQIESIIQASISNGQIYNANQYSPEIIGDVLKKLIQPYSRQINPDLVIGFQSKFSDLQKLSSEEEQS